MSALPNRIMIPLIVASALFIQQIDSTALATSLPAIAAALGESPVRTHLVITAYMFSLAAFVPVSGWIADRFGARLIFRIAIAIFTLSSLACSAVTTLDQMVVARVCQGFGGALMVPVARLILVRSVEKNELVRALALMSMPSLVGPIIGPLIGGFLTSYASWKWIFWVNLPIGIVGIILVTLLIPDIREAERRRFDLLGVALLGVGLSSLLFGIDGAASGSASPGLMLLCAGIGAAFLVIYGFHARRNKEPVLDLGLLRIVTFRMSLIGGSVFRISAASIPFLLPLLFQTQFGYTPFQSGGITFVAAVGALGLRTVSSRILRRFGFRSVLIWNGIISGAFMAGCALLRPSVPTAIILLALLLGGIFRSLELVSMNAMTFADLRSNELSQATSFSQMVQRLAQSVGVALSASILHAATTSSGLPHRAFDIAFVTLACLAWVAVILFRRLPPDAGAELTGHKPT